jgi:isoquinoline 1-oxidoreductase alpha subunit
MMIKVTELLEHNPKPSDAEIKAALTTSGPSPHLCRCANYAAILDGVHRAVLIMADRGAI